MAKTFKFNGEELTILQAAKKFGIHKNTLRARLAKHPPEIAVVIPFASRSERAKTIASRVTNGSRHPWRAVLKTD